MATTTDIQFGPTVKTDEQYRIAREVARQVNRAWQLMFSLKWHGKQLSQSHPQVSRDEAIAAVQLVVGRYHETRMRIGSFTGPLGQWLRVEQFEGSADPRQEPIWQTVRTWYDWYFTPTTDEARKVLQAILHAAHHNAGCASKADDLLHRLRASTLEPDYHDALALLDEVSEFLQVFLPIEEKTEEPAELLDDFVAPPSDDDGDDEPDLKDRHIECMEAMRLLKATRRDRRKPAAKIMRKTQRPLADPSTIKEPLADLVRWGYAGSETGRNGGSWLTPEGRTALARAKRQRKQ